MSPAPRSLPLRVRWCPGEALDSWLIRLAGRNGASIKRIAPALGLSEQARGWRHFTWVKGIEPGRLRAIEQQAGLETLSLDGAVLDRFDRLGWLPVAGSRFCPSCLRGSGGVWLIRWQLPYSIACTQHRCLLATTCPDCGMAPHLRMGKHAGTLPSHRCTSLPRGAPDICRADLLTVRPLPLSSNDPRLRAQCWVDERLDRMNERAITNLRDLDILARWFGTRVFPVDVTDLGSDTARAIDNHRNPDLHLPWRRPHPGRILVDAALTRLAVGVLTAADPETRYRRFAPLFRDVGATAKAHAASFAPKMLSPKRLRKLSEPCHQSLLTACDRHLPVSERLRYYTATPTPRLPRPGPSQAGERARWIPQRLWQDWLVRFAPVKGAHPTAIAVDIPAALLLPGNPVRNIQATAELGPWRVSSANTLTKIARTYPDVLKAICNLADYLDAEGGPIDYRRRRATFTDIDLSKDAWQDLCARLSVPPGFGLKLHYVRLHLFSMLTGADILTATTLPGSPSDKIRTSYNSYFKNRLQVRLRAALTEHAEKLLEAAGIHEPVTWSPPGDCVAGLRLPGPDPTSLPVASLTDCMDRLQLSATAAAAQLGTTTEHVRYLMEQRDPVPSKAKRRPARPGRPRPEHKPTLHERILEPATWSAAHLLSRRLLEEHLVGNSKSTQQLADETGFAIATIRKYAKIHGIKSTYKPKHAKKIPIDPGWFRHQTEVLKRTNTEIAAELGISGETLRRRRLELGIESNPTGIYHTRLFPELPDDIRAAVEGQQGGWTRLYRLEQTMAFPSVNVAAKKLGYFTSNLNLQINRLEHDIGAKLIERGHRYQPMKPTARGRQLLHDLQRPEVQALLNQYAQKTRIDKPNRRRSRPPNSARPAY